MKADQIFFSSGESSIRLQENLRDTLLYLSEEVRKSDRDHVQIIEGGGNGTSDLIKFSIPVLCSDTAKWLDECDASKEGVLDGCDEACGSFANGCDNAACPFNEGVDCGETLVAHWGASLRWKCNSSTCMDANNNCTSVEYKYIQYGLNNDGNLVRSVLDTSNTIVNQVVLRANLEDLQFSRNGTVVRATITGKETAPMTGREETLNTVLDILSSKLEI